MDMNMKRRTPTCVLAAGLGLILSTTGISMAAPTPEISRTAPMAAKMQLKAKSGAHGYIVQTAGNAGNARAGEKGASVASSALLSVVVSRKNGRPATNLGANVGNGTSGITLPARWGLFSNLNVPPGGCLLSPTQFYNWGNGAYNIRVVPFLNTPTCKWLSGDYHYVVQVKNNNGQVIGLGLGTLTID